MVQGKLSTGARGETFYGGGTKILISSLLFVFFFFDVKKFTCTGSLIFTIRII